MYSIVKSRWTHNGLLKKKPVPQSTAPGENEPLHTTISHKTSCFWQTKVSQDDIIDFTPEVWWSLASLSEIDKGEII